MELTVLMPCLNEAETIASCIGKAKRFLEEHGVRGEILVADNGSTDGSVDLAIEHGARVIHVQRRGYGAALIEGISNSAGQFVIMADADDSYDFYNLLPFLEKLRKGTQLVVGNRFSGGIQQGAMPFLHRYLGNPVLSLLGRRLFGLKVRDFHCGLRGFCRKSIAALNLQASGMEFASEMIVKSGHNKLKIDEVPTTLAKDGRSRAPHLRTWVDGWRHLKFLLMLAPRATFLLPGIISVIVGLVIVFNSILGVGFFFTPMSVIPGVHSMLYSMAMILVGIELLFMYLLFSVLARSAGSISGSPILLHRPNWFEWVVFVGACMVTLGFFLAVSPLQLWISGGFGELDPAQVMRRAIPAVLLLMAGVQLIANSFLLAAVTYLLEGRYRQ